MSTASPHESRTAAMILSLLTLHMKAQAPHQPPDQIHKKIMTARLERSTTLRAAQSSRSIHGWPG